MLLHAQQNAQEQQPSQRDKRGLVVHNRSAKRLTWIVVFCTLFCIHQLSKSKLSTVFLINKDTARDARKTKHENSPSPTNFAFTEQDMRILEENDCFVLEDICISQGRYWFYKHSAVNNPRQPDFIFEPELNPNLNLPPRISVKSSEVVISNTQSCETSPIPNHMIVTGEFIDMVMEVYVRIVAGLWELWNKFPATHWWKATPATPHIQLYAHIQGNTTQLPPSMNSLLKSFSSNTLLNILNLYDRGGDCRCFSRMAFCGYFDATARSRMNRKGQKYPNGPVQTSKKQSTDPLPGSPGGVFKPGLQVGRRKSENVNPPIRWDSIRNHTRNGVFLSYPNIHERILDFKRDVLVRALSSIPNATTAWIQKEAKERISEWTLVGFSQRNVRRRWLNLERTLEQCLKKWLHFKIVCVEIHLDSPLGRVPENQVIMHAGLDALIGVHGSQQVHAVWMPDGAYILELLPHLLGHWGQWTQTTERRTPNGKMINHTGLNHIGYPLDVSSVPDCQGALRHLEECNNEQRWDFRDIVVDPKIIESFVNKFLILPTYTSATIARRQTVSTSSPRLCKDFEKLAYDEFVLYHINCEYQGQHEYRHYFRSRGSFVHLQQPIG